MIWDARQRRYEDDSGRPLTPEEIRNEIEVFITSEQEEVNKQSDGLLKGAITIGVFFAFMRQKITAWHAITGSIAYGGEAQMTAERWGRINDKIKSEIEFLDNFQSQVEASHAAAESIAAQVAQNADIPAGLDSVVEERVREALLTAAPSDAETVIKQAVEDALLDSVDDVTPVVQAATSGLLASAVGALIGGTIASRAGMYTDGVWGSYQSNVIDRERSAGITMARRVCEDDDSSCEECIAAATEEFIPIDEIPEIGSLQCLSNCRCLPEFDIGQDDQTSLVQ